MAELHLDELTLEIEELEDRTAPNAIWEDAPPATVVPGP